MSGIEYPVKLNDISKFEKFNPAYSVNVLGYSDEKVSIHQGNGKHSEPMV